MITKIKKKNKAKNDKSNVPFIFQFKLFFSSQVDFVHFLHINDIIQEELFRRNTASESLKN